MAVSKIAQRFLAAAARSGDVNAYMREGRLKHLFKNVEREHFDRFDKHVRRHAAMPSEALMSDWWDNVPPTPDTPSYYLALLRNRHIETSLSKIVSEANELVGEGESLAAAELIVTRVMPEIMRQSGNQLIDLSEAYDLVTSNYYQQMKLGDDYGVQIGYPIVDEYGGMVGGDVLSIVGRPAAGKSFLGARAGHEAQKRGKSSAFVSLEMNNLITAQRLVALDAELPLNGLKLQKGSGLSTPQLKRLGAAKKQAKDKPPLHLIDGNLSTSVEDLYNLCRMLQPELLVIDGAYMLKHPNPRIGRFERVAENCELIKKEIAGNLGVPVIASWQFSRDAAKKMANSRNKQEVGLEDIGYSDAIGQISSIVLGLLQEETIETMTRKKVTIMKGRSGETGSFDINWQFSPTLNFDHIPKKELSELSFI